MIANTPAVGLYYPVFWMAPRQSFQYSSCVIFGFPWQALDALSPVRPVCHGGVSSYPSTEGPGAGATYLEGRREQQCSGMVLALITKTHNSCLALRAALSLLNHRAAQTNTIQGWVSFQI